MALASNKTRVDRCGGLTRIFYPSPRLTGAFGKQRLGRRRPAMLKPGRCDPRGVCRNDNRAIPHGGSTAGSLLRLVKGSTTINLWGVINGVHA